MKNANEQTSAFDAQILSEKNCLLRLFKTFYTSTIRRYISSNVNEVFNVMSHEENDNYFQQHPIKLNEIEIQARDLFPTGAKITMIESARERFKDCKPRLL